MEQNRIESLVEVLVNTFIGFLVSYVAWPIAGWLYDVPLSSAKQAGVVFFFTILSVIRGYVIRRWFVGWLAKFNKRLSLWIYSKLQRG